MCPGLPVTESLQMQFSSFIEKGGNFMHIPKALHDNPYLSSGFASVDLYMPHCMNVGIIVLICNK